MKWKEFNKVLTTWLAKFFIVICVLSIIFGAIKTCTENTKQTIPPVEGYEIDSITKENDRLIIEIEQIDSIKDAKFIEVKNLDNDSTLKLFYKLIGK